MAGSASQIRSQTTGHGRLPLRFWLLTLIVAATPLAFNALADGWWSARSGQAVAGVLRQSIGASTWWGRGWNRFLGRLETGDFSVVQLAIYTALGIGFLFYLLRRR